MDRTLRRTRRVGIALGLAFVAASAIGCGSESDRVRSSGTPSTTSRPKVDTDAIPVVDRRISIGGSMLLEPGTVVPNRRWYEELR